MKKKLHSYKRNRPKKKYTFLGNRFARSLFRSKEGHVIHADINASFNIIRKVTGDIIYNFVDKGFIKGSSPKDGKLIFSSESYVTKLRRYDFSYF